MQYQSFNPPQRLLMGPGPSQVSSRVLAAMARPTIGHLDPQFVRLMDEISELLRGLFRTRNQLTMPVSAPGSAGMESCFANLIECGDKVIICRNGYFGGRMQEMAERMGGQVVMVEDEWGDPVDPAKAEDALKQHPDAKVLAIVHAETSTGALSDAKTLAALAHKHNCVTIVDAVTSMGALPLEVDEWELDAVYSGSQKNLSGTPGLSPLTFGPRALERIKQRRSRCQSWFMDVNLVMQYWSGESKRAYHHTAPINALYALHESLLMIHEEGVENAWARHAAMHKVMRAGLEALGLTYIGRDGARLPNLNAVMLPDGMNEGLLRARLLDDFELEIGGGLGALAGKAWRIGLMGTACSAENVLTCLSAVGAVLAAEDSSIDAGAGVAAAARLLNA